MHHISATQIKAARAMLGWLQDDLAEASGLSISTIRSLETGYISLRSAKEVRKAFEKSGLEFTEGDGIKRRDDQIKVYRGPDSCDKFFDDMLQTIKKDGGDVLCIIKSQDIMMQSCGITNNDNIDRLEFLSQMTDVKGLVCDTSAPAFFVPSLELRITSKHHVGPYPCYIYGDKYAQVVHEGRMNFSFVVLNIPHVAHNYRSHFLSLWDNALPLRTQDTPQERRAKSVI